MRYILDHTVLFFRDHICWWDVLALIILVCVCVYAYRHIKAMKELEEKLEDRLAGKKAGEALTEEYELQT